MIITEKNMKNVIANYMAYEANEAFNKEMALWSLESSWNVVLEKYPEEAKEFLYKITAEVMKNDE